MGSRQVAVLCELRGAALAIVVADNGHGFTEASRARIFEPYYTTKPNGLGMGLAICRSIVEAHGGSIAAAIAPEGGARFEFTIPLAPAPPPE
jgi:two-component system sensor histidine kinase TtrS